MKIGLQFDENGNYVGDYLEGMILPEGHTVVPTHLAEGKFNYLPKLVDGEVVEGLSQAEIDDILNSPKSVDAMTAIGEQIVHLELENAALKQQNSTLGQQLVNLELRLLQLEGGGA